MNRRIGSTIGLGLVAVGSLIAAPAVASDDYTIVCPPLGPRAEAIAFFTDRGFPPAAETALGDGVLWTSRRDELIARVEGDDLASLIRLEAFFTSEPNDPDTVWFWSADAVIDVLTWGPELMRTYAHQDPPDPEWAWDLSDLPDTWPGIWGIESGDRKALMEIRLDAEGMHVSVEISAKAAPTSTCDPVASPGP